MPKKFGSLAGKRITIVTTKKKKTVSKKATLNKNILKLPKARVKMKWANSYLLQQGTVDLPTSQIFRWTSLYDPDKTSVSIADHQPWSYDTYSNFYKHYTVVGCTAVVKCTHYSPDANLSTIFLTNSATSAPSNLTTYVQFLENPSTSGGLVHSDKPITVFKKSYSKKKVYGNTQNSKLLGNTGGLTSTPIGTNPDEEYFLMVTIHNSEGLISSDVAFTVELTYDCELTENKTLATS